MGLAVVYKLPTKRRHELVQRAKEPSALGWWDRPPPGVPRELGALASYEAEAISMVDWSPGLLPGLLQTPAYTRAILDENGVTEYEVEPRLRARQQRQLLLERRDVDYHAFLGMAALTNHLGDKAAFVEQLRQVHRLSRRQGISIRVVEVPTCFSIGSWYLMYFEQTGSVVVVEHLGSTTFLFDEETKPYTACRVKLNKMALSEQETRDKIDLLIEQYTLGS
jgi:hypothetical protein